MTQNIFTLGLAFVALGIEINSALGVIGIIATALSAIASLFASLFGMKDKRLEKKIKKQEELVKSLEKQYKKLEKQIKQTYDLNTFDMANKQAKENIEEQIKARLISDIDELEELLREHYYEYEQMLGNHRRNFDNDELDSVWGETGDIYNYKQIWIDPLEQELKAKRDALELTDEDDSYLAE